MQNYRHERKEFLVLVVQCCVLGLANGLYFATHAYMLIYRTFRFLKKRRARLHKIFLDGTSKALLVYRYVSGGRGSK